MDSSSALTSIENEITAIRTASNGVSPPQLHEHAAVLERYRAWCRRALAETHLVTVAAMLYQTFNGQLNDLEAIGLPVDLLPQFPNWQSGSRSGFQPASLGITPTPAGAGEPITSLRLQLSPASGTIPYALMLLRDLLQQMDAAVQFVVVVEPGANLAGLDTLVNEFEAGTSDRVRFVELPSITVFAQDNARAARDKTGTPTLFIPRAFRRGGARAEDELTPEAAAQAFEMPVIQSRLYWEGGNIINDAQRCFIGVDTIAENMARLGLTEAEVLESFRAELGSDVIPLGDLSQAHFDPGEDKLTVSGQASFHIDLDVSLLAKFGRKRRPRALIADPAHGLDLLPAVLAQQVLFANHFLEADQVKDLIAAEYDAFARERHPQLLTYCDTLEALGYRVIGVPDLRLDPQENLFQTTNFDFSYCNVLPGLQQGRPAVHYLPWGIPQLDLDAEKRFRKAGVEPIRISTNPRIANTLMQLYGGLHCFCGPLV